jgi:hypothetical protein
VDEWEKRGRSPSVLLQSNDIGKAEQWLVQCTDKEPKPTVHQREYIQASRQSSINRQRKISVGILTALVISLALGILAFSQYRAAQNREQQRVTQQAIAESEANSRATQQVIAESEVKSRATQETVAQTEKNKVRSLEMANKAKSALAQGDIDWAVVLALAANELNSNLPEVHQILADLAYSVGTFWNFRVLQPITCVEISGDGQTIIAGLIPPPLSHENSGSTVIFLDVETGNEMKRIEGLKGEISALAISPDERYILAGFGATYEDNLKVSDRFRISVLEMSTGKVINYVLHHEANVAKILINPKGDSVLSISTDGMVVLWDFVTGAIISDNARNFL